MIARNIIDISNHPILTDVTRKAQVFRSYKEYDTNRVVLVLNIFHYKGDEEIKYFPKQIELISDNETKVDPQTGTIVEKTVLQPKENEEDPDVFDYPEGSIGEYQYLWYIVNVAKAYTEIELHTRPRA